MDQTQQNPTGTPGGTPQEEKSMGPLIGSVIIVAIIVIGGIYFWMTRSAETPTPALPETAPLGQTTTPDQETAALLNQGTSDNTADIEKDLNATDLNNLDAGMNDIKAQL